MPITTRVFICYRQVDGMDAAAWLYRELHGQTYPLIGQGSDDTQQLDVYFDQAAPALSDWQALHRPSLEAAHALLVVCTPGMFSRLGEQDWVHMEIDWWLRNRSTAPILIDTTGEGARWVPQSISTRWPNAQRLRLSHRELEQLPQAEREAAVQMLVQRLVGGISTSEGAIRFEELEQRRAMLQRQKRLLSYIAVAMAATALASAVATWFSYQSRQQAERRLASTLVQQAYAALELDNSDFAKILSAEALTHDGSARTRNAAAVIHHWYAGQVQQSLERFDSLLAQDYQGLVEEGARLQRSQRHARGQSVISALDTYLVLTATAKQPGYEWVYRLGGYGTRMGRSIHLATLADAGAGTEVAQLARTSSEVARLFYHRPARPQDIDACSHERDQAAAQTAQTELALSSRVARRAVASFQAGPEGAQLQSRLRPGQAMVHYWRYRDRYAAWVIIPDAPARRVELGSAQEIESAARDFLHDVRNMALAPRQKSLVGGPAAQPGQAIRGFEPDGSASSGHAAATAAPSSPVGTRLRQLIWDPVWARMPQASSLVYVVPDAAMASVPFAALPDGTSGGHLLDRLHFAHLTTAQDLMDDPAPAAGLGVLLVANAHTPTDAPRAGQSKSPCNRELFDRQWFPALPGSEFEVRSISALLKGAGASWAPRVLVGGEAEERTVREAMVGRRILHFATHAWLDSQAYGRPEDKPAPVIADAGPSIDTYLVNADPLLRTGLLLGRADAGLGMADGYLSGYEVAALDLRGVELVVLSACDTAGSSRGGNGLVGLTTAFREAGARSVVASLYPVDDAATARLMPLFYRHLSQGMVPAIALTEAMRVLKRDGGSAYQWAPFVAYSTAVAP